MLILIKLLNIQSITIFLRGFWSRMFIQITLRVESAWNNCLNKYKCLSIITWSKTHKTSILLWIIAFKLFPLINRINEYRTISMVNLINHKKNVHFVKLYHINEINFILWCRRKNYSYTNKNTRIYFNIPGTFIF